MFEEVFVELWKHFNMQKLAFQRPILVMCTTVKYCAWAIGLLCQCRAWKQSDL